jgi:Ser/Thr protein kinase RdoA (MazF antagonist)
LINSSYKITSKSNEALFLQKINKTIFKKPAYLQENYVCLREYLLSVDSFSLPAIVPTKNNSLIHNCNGEAWRSFKFISNTYSHSIADTANKAYNVASTFGKFTADLTPLDPVNLKIILPDFHNLNFRFNQFETAVQHADEASKKDAKNLIENVLKRTRLIDWYRSIRHKQNLYPTHILHHDCKIANILFEQGTGKVLFPIDLDTTQPGLFFSDLGDMIRSMVPNLDENHTNIDELELRTDFYKAIIEGYSDAMSNHLTENEKQDLHLAGPVLIYMQAIRFLTDYLNKNIYYKVAYPTQNKDRAVNQLRLLELLEDHLKQQ